MTQSYRTPGQLHYEPPKYQSLEIDQEGFGECPGFVRSRFRDVKVRHGQIVLKGKAGPLKKGRPL